MRYIIISKNNTQKENILKNSTKSSESCGSREINQMFVETLEESIFDLLVDANNQDCNKSELLNELLIKYEVSTPHIIHELGSNILAELKSCLLPEIQNIFEEECFNLSEEIKFMNLVKSDNIHWGDHNSSEDTYSEISTLSTTSSIYSSDSDGDENDWKIVMKPTKTLNINYDGNDCIETSRLSVESSPRDSSKWTDHTIRRKNSKGIPLYVLHSNRPVKEFQRQKKYQSALTPIASGLSYESKQKVEKKNSNLKITMGRMINSLYKAFSSNSKGKSRYRIQQVAPVG